MKGLEEYKFTEILNRWVPAFSGSTNPGYENGGNELICNSLSAILKTDEESGFLKCEKQIDIFFHKINTCYCGIYKAGLVAKNDRAQKIPRM
jgi:hypothetical protein